MASNTYSADVALADALVKLKSVEEDNLALKTKLKQLMTDSRALESTGGGGEWSREIERLKKQNSEVSEGGVGVGERGGRWEVKVGGCREGVWWVWR